MKISELYDASQEEHRIRKNKGFTQRLTGEVRLPDCFSTILLKVRDECWSSKVGILFKEHLWLLLGHDCGGEDDVQTLLS